MKDRLYRGNLKKCVYNGYAGNIFSVDHIAIIEEGVYLIKLKENEYIRLEELLDNKKKKEKLKDFATKVGQIYVDDLVLVNDLIDSNNQNKKL